MNMNRSEFVLGALSAALVGCSKDVIAEDTKNTKEKIKMKKPLVVYFSEASGISVGQRVPDSGEKRCEHGARSAECLQRAA